jgi:CXXC-20-CXXC protein
MKCPNCGNKVKFWTEVRFHNSQEIPCPNCTAVLKATERFMAVFVMGIVGIPLAMFFSGFLIVIAYLAPRGGGGTPSYELVMFLVFLGVLASILITVALVRVKKVKVVRLRPKCQYCGTVMALEDAEFCTNCGASMEGSAWERIKVSEQVETQNMAHRVTKSKPTGTCLVCNLEMNAGEALTCCPYCGNTFHRNHLTEWVHTKKRCPACYEHLEESELKELPLHSQMRSKRGKSKRTDQ